MTKVPHLLRRGGAVIWRVIIQGTIIRAPIFQGQFCWRQLSGGNYPGGYPGGNFPGGQLPSGNCPESNYLGGNCPITLPGSEVSNEYIKITDDSKSDLRNTTCGMPQSSILGLLLFLVYVNDLPSSSKILQMTRISFISTKI